MLAVPFAVEEFVPIAEVLNEVPVAVDVGVEMVKLPGRRPPPGVGVVRVEFAHFSTSGRSSKNSERR